MNYPRRLADMGNIKIPIQTNLVEESQSDKYIFLESVVT